jgi:hypothetical protein
LPSSASAVVIWITNLLSGLISGIGGSFDHSMRQKSAGQPGPASFGLNASVRGGVPERRLEDGSGGAVEIGQDHVRRPMGDAERRP